MKKSSFLACSFFLQRMEEIEIGVLLACAKFDQAHSNTYVRHNTLRLDEVNTIENGESISHLNDGYM